MHTVDLIASSLADDQREPLPIVPELGICCVTGIETETIPANKLLGSNFMDNNLLNAPHSNRVGVNVWYAFQYGYLTDPTKKRKKKPEFMACWYCDGQQFAEVDKVAIRQFVLHGSSAFHWAGWITTSYKKHGALRSPVNSKSFGFWGFDDLLVNASNPATVLEIWQRLRQAQDIGIGRTGLETLDIPVGIMLKIGITKCNEFVTWAQSHYQSPLYKLLIYLLPSQQELKNGYTDGNL